MTKQYYYYQAGDERLANAFIELYRAIVDNPDHLAHIAKGQAVTYAMQESFLGPAMTLDVVNNEVFEKRLAAEKEIR